MQLSGEIMSDITKEEMRERLANIEQIRDIIFGSNIRDFNNRFEKMESDISRLQQEVHDYAQQVKGVFSTEIRATNEAFEKKYKSLSTETKEETAELRQQFERINRKFSNSIESLDQSLDSQTNLIRDELNQTRDGLQEDFRNLKTQVFEQIDKRLSMMGDVKVSKHDMAEILFEMGMKLKGTEFVPQLQEAADTNMYTDVQLLESTDN